MLWGGGIKLVKLLTYVNKLQIHFIQLYYYCFFTFDYFLVIIYEIFHRKTVFFFAHHFSIYAVYLLNKKS